MQRVRLRYTKRGRLRFTSHRDFQRAFERALRRAGVPMAYSAGFTPHPKVSYANAAPTGTGSEAEYLEIALAERRDPEVLRALLDESLPTGLDIVDAVEAHGSDFADRLEASAWELRLDGVTPEEAASAVERFLAAETVEVSRQTKKGLRSFDARAAVVSLRVVPPEEAVAPLPSGSLESAAFTRATESSQRACAILRLVVRHLTPAVRPDDVLSGLRATADLAPPVPAAATRLAQGPLDRTAATVTDPFAHDRDAAQSASPMAAGQPSAAAVSG
ncbi:TIGR03936 family radical SAM-associated protein [Streptomyces sp. NPDC005438]|uniref:TIGR03936 family radical SAM-associated protein n=1 Tax=Streptomyces sp. NPDC005438 TaxID=3156880 RepID=UPI0033B3B54D